MPGLLVSYFRWTQRRGTILEEPLQSTAGRVHSRPVGGGAWSALLRVQKVEPSSPPLEWTHESPPSPRHRMRWK